MNTSSMIIWNGSNCTKTIINQNKPLLLTCCHQQFYIEYMKQRMSVMKYEGE